MPSAREERGRRDRRVTYPGSEVRFLAPEPGRLAIPAASHVAFEPKGDTRVGINPGENNSGRCTGSRRRRGGTAKCERGTDGEHPDEEDEEADERDREGQQRRRRKAGPAKPARKHTVTQHDGLRPSVLGTPPAVVEEGTGGVGARLRAARRGAGLTQQQLAEALGVEPITVSRWEREVTSPSRPRLRRIAELTGTSLSDLVRDADPAATALAAELAAIREELAETRELIDRVARAVERLALPRSPAGSLLAPREE